jgi:hypothetical protein
MERHIYQYCCRTVIRRTIALQPCGGQRPNLLREREVRGGRNARATGTHSRALPISPGDSPSRIASCHRLRRNHLSASLRVLTCSMNPLSASWLRAATKKHFALVQKLWTIGLPCGSLRKTAEESRPFGGSRDPFLAPKWQARRSSTVPFTTIIMRPRISIQR